MNAQQLFTADGLPTKAWYCSVCRNVRPTEAKASECCQPCACGNATESPFHRVCKTCMEITWRRDAAQREQQAFDKAEKIPEAEYTGYVHNGDEYYSSTDAFRDDFDGQAFEVPDYVWATAARPVCVIPDALELISQATDEAPEDFEPQSLAGIHQLQEAVDAFNALNADNVCYQEDRKRAVILSKEPPNEP